MYFTLVQDKSLSVNIALLEEVDEIIAKSRSHSILSIFRTFISNLLLSFWVTASLNLFFEVSID